MIPAGKRRAVLDTLDDAGVEYALTDEVSGREYTAVVSFPLPTEAVEPILERLREAGIERESYTVVLDEEGSMTGMLTEVQRRHDRDKWAAWLAWAPHPMNINHDMEYLAGGAQYWGPNKGEVIVNTVTPTGFAWACQNIGQFLDNYDWTVEEQSLAMGYVNNDGMEPLEAGKKVIRKNPQMIERWFARSGISSSM